MIIRDYRIYKCDLWYCIILIYHLLPFSSEENCRLLDNSATVFYNNAVTTDDDEEEVEKLYNKMNSKFNFHCHDGCTSSNEESKIKSRNAKRKLIIACVLVLLFICLEVRYDIWCSIT